MQLGWEGDTMNLLKWLGIFDEEPIGLNKELLPKSWNTYSKRSGPWFHLIETSL